MSIWNKVLIGLIFAASLGFLVLGARALKTRQYWGEAAEKLQADIEAANAEGALLEDGDESTMGVRDAQVAVHELLVDRGRVWRNCGHGAVVATGQGVSLKVTTDRPDPNGIAVNSVLFIFEQKPVKDGGAYLGEFTVTGKGNKDLQLVPTMQLNARELQRLQQSNGPWALYDVMPIDQHDVLVGLSEDEIRAMFPEATADEYLADRQAAQAAEAPGAEATKPPRKLRSYEVLFAENHKQRSMANDSIAAAKHDLQAIQEALADATKQVQFRQAEIASLQKEKTSELEQLAAVGNHLKAVEAKLNEVQTSVDQLMTNNQTLASDIARMQLEATRQIDKQTERVAQAANL